MRALLTGLALLIPVAASATPQHGVLPWNDRRPQARNPLLLQSTMIAAHNQARRQYGVAPLAWDHGLARDASVWAARLARTNRFEHDRQRGRNPRQGENLFVGTRGAYSYGEMIGLLIDERRYFRPGRFPNVSRAGSVSQVGHYTQIIWPTTQRVGCAVASSRSSDYLVCRYFPAGNIYGTVLR